MDGRIFLTIFEMIVLLIAIVTVFYANKINKRKKEKIVLKTEDGEIILYGGIKINAVKLQKVDYNFSIIHLFLKDGNKIEFTIKNDNIDNFIEKLLNINK